MRVPIAFVLALVLCAQARGDVRSERTGDAVILSDGGRELLRYQAEPGPLPDPAIDSLFRRGGYLHPVRTPSGRVVTGDFPADHRHHHGIWFAWTKTEFDGRTPDFWNMGQGTGRVDFAGVETLGPKGFVSRHRAVDLTSGKPVNVLEERWNVELVEVSAERTIFDLEISQDCATDKSLHLPKYHYGGLGFRAPENWTGSDFQILTSAGETSRIRANESRAKWIRISGPVDGTSATIAILCHGDNFRAPQPLRVHPTDPFVCFAPPQLGDMKITPGQSFVSRYRIITSDETLEPEELDRLWEEFR